MPPGLTLSSDKIVHALDGFRRAQDDDKIHARGTLGALRRGEELDVYLTRRCDTLTVEICPGILGKELFYGLKRAFAHKRTELFSVHWPTCISNRIAHGVAGFCWGGKSVEALASYSLGAADFVKHDYDAFERFVVPADAKLENRPRGPSTLYAWNSLPRVRSMPGAEFMDRSIAKNASEPLRLSSQLPRKTKISTRHGMSKMCGKSCAELGVKGCESSEENSAGKQVPTTRGRKTSSRSPSRLTPARVPRRLPPLGSLISTTLKGTISGSVSRAIPIAWRTSSMRLCMQNRLPGRRARTTMQMIASTQEARTRRRSSQRGQRLQRRQGSERQGESI